MNKKEELKKVLFLCTGNSARSQMAEGFLKNLGKGRFEVYSAGIAPAGINPYAIRVMQEVGIDISKQSSNAVNSELLVQVDLLITLCGDARDNCPVVLEKVKKRHWALEDPTSTKGSDMEIMEKYRATRDIIRSHIKAFLKEE